MPICRVTRASCRRLRYGLGQSIASPSMAPQLNGTSKLTQHFARLELEPVLVFWVADQSVKFSRMCWSALNNLRFHTRHDTHAAASYQRSIWGPNGALTPARSAVFHRTCMRWPRFPGVWFSTGKACTGCMLTPSLPLAWAKSLVLLRVSYASGSSSWRRAAMLKPSTSDDSPPLPSVWERRWRAWRPLGELVRCGHSQDV